MITVFAFLVFCFVAQHVFAVSAYPGAVRYRLPDGTEIIIHGRGDEHVSWSVSPDGFTLLRNADGFLEYATTDPYGYLKLSGVRARNESDRTPEEKSFLVDHPKNLRFSQSQIETMRGLRGARENLVKTMLPAEGSRKTLPNNVRIPIILVAFQDKPFTRTKEEFEMLFNNLGYTAGGTITGSLRDYFLANSYGQLDLQVDIFGPYTLPNPISYYTNNKDCGGNSQNMARQAIDSAHFRGQANWALYDMNNTGVVSTVHIIFAGHGTEAFGGIENCSTIWSHAWAFSPARNYGGRSISRFSCSPELRGNSGTNITHIGVIAHELGHSLFGLPDFYDTDYSGSGGEAICLGAWDLMATGVWNDGGRTPAFFSAYGRSALEWAPVVTLSSSMDITMHNPCRLSKETGVIYRVNTTTPNEYFLFENRQQTSWDAFIPGSGLLIYHVDKNHSGWANNNINSNPNRRGYYVKQAGCMAITGCSYRANDPFPRGTFTSFTDESIPNSKSWSGKNTEKPVTGITRDLIARTVSFKFMGGNPTSYDAALTKVVLPYFLFETGVQEVGVRLENFGKPLTSASIIWHVNGISQTPYQWSGELAPSGSVDIILGSVNFDFGVHTIRAMVVVEDDIDDTNNSVSKTIKVIEPFFFEDWETSHSDGWVFANQNQPNKWIVGSATSSRGSKSAYISDNESENQYTVTKTSRVHLYHDITFPASLDSFDLFFDVRCVGEWSPTNPGLAWDYLEVYIVEPPVIPLPGSVLSPETNFGTKLGRHYNVDEWETVSYALPPSYANTTKRLVFSWYNDNSIGEQPPAAIDNIAIVKRSIPPYRAILSETNTHTFPNAIYGYTEQEPLAIVVFNSGTRPTGTLNIALSGTYAKNFTLSQTSITSIDMGIDSNFTVVPNIGLSVGTYTATVTVSGGGGNAILNSFKVSFTVVVAPSPPTITTDVLPCGTVDIDYSATLSAKGNKPITWSLLDTINTKTQHLALLPDGLILSYSGIISGKPTQTDTFTFWVVATNAMGSDTAELTIAVATNPATSAEGTQHSTPLRAWKYNDVLHIEGLTIGQPYRIYTVSGVLVCYGVATTDVVTASVSHTKPSQGAYIIQTEKKSVKVVY
jgi:M6 family metalloprotease-like protein